MNVKSTMRGQEVLQYREHLLTTAKYAAPTQWALKRRAFETFHQLLIWRNLKGLGAETRLLDLGAADGAFVSVCRDAGVNASGLDISDGINFETDALPIDSETVDVVTAASVIEHLYSPAKMLSECFRVLRPGGAVILVCPNWRFNMQGFFDDPTHVHPYTEVSLRRVLATHGFQKPYVVPWLVKKPAWLWDVPRSFFLAAHLIPFRGDAPSWVPGILKGRTRSLLGLGEKPVAVAQASG